MCDLQFNVSKDILNKIISDRRVKTVTTTEVKPSLSNRRKTYFIDRKRKLVTYQKNLTAYIDSLVLIRIKNHNNLILKTLNNLEYDTLCMPKNAALIKWKDLEKLDGNNIQYELCLNADKSLRILEYKLLNKVARGRNPPIYPYDKISTAIDIVAIINTWENLCQTTSTNISHMDLDPLTIESRHLKLIRIKENSDEPQLPKPQILITSVHHAREPVSVTNVLFCIETMLKLNKDGQIDLEYPLPEEEPELFPTLLRSEISGDNQDIIDIYLTHPNTNNPIAGFQFSILDIDLTTNGILLEGLAFETFNILMNTENMVLLVSTMSNFIYTDDSNEVLLCRIQCDHPINDNLICLTDIIVATPNGNTYEVHFTNEICLDNNRNNNRNNNQIWFDSINRTEKFIIINISTSNNINEFSFDLEGVTIHTIEEHSSYTIQYLGTTITVSYNGNGDYQSGNFVFPNIYYHNIEPSVCIANVVFTDTNGENIEMDIGDCLNYHTFPTELEEKLNNFDLETIRYILRTRDIFFIPLVNPDGYYHNYEEHSSGGGYWRKNRNHTFTCNNEVAGVDLNRNYSYHHCESYGSSRIPCSDQFCGCILGNDDCLEGFTEPETLVIRNLFLENDFRLALNHHTFGNLLIYPDNTTTPEELDNYQLLANKLAEDNQFQPGTPFETVNYRVAGSAIQYQREHCMAFTPETGDYDDGFWPSNTKVFELNIKNLDMHKKAFLLAGQYYEASNLQFNGGSIIKRNVKNRLTLEIRNIGLFPRQGETDEHSVCTINIVFPNNHIVTLNTSQSIVSLAESILIDEWVDVPILSNVNEDDQLEILIEIKDGYDNDFSFNNSFTMQAGPIVGDVNQDGELNVLDIVKVINYIIGTGELSEEEYLLADINNDGDVNILDIINMVNDIIPP